MDCEIEKYILKDYFELFNGKYICGFEIILAEYIFEIT